MNRSDPKSVRDKISGFHAKRFAGRGKKNFHLWLISPEDRAAKDEAMARVWDSLSVPEAGRSADRSLKTVMKRLGMTPEAGPTKTIVLNRLIRTAAAVLIPVALVLGIYFAYTGFPVNEEWVVVEIPYGETGHCLLHDGTEVWLNAGSTFSYPVRFDRENREVNLEGEGFFNVAGDEEWPFTVRTTHMQVKVLGTEFEIRCYGDMEYGTVTVVSGRVDVTTEDGKTHELAPGSQLMHWSDGGETHVEEVSVPVQAQWMENGLVFEGNTLGDIFSTLQRKYDLRVEIADPSRLTGSLYRMRFLNGESLDYILNVIRSVSEVPCSFEGGVLTVGAGNAVRESE